MSLTMMGGMSGCVRKQSSLSSWCLCYAILCMNKKYLILYFPSRIPPFYEENTHLQIPGPLHKRVRELDEQAII